MKSIICQGLILACIFFGEFATFAQEKTPVPVIAKVAQAMTAAVEKFEAPGVTTLVADASGVVHQHSTGWADVAAKKPLQPDAIMWIASMSKPVAGAATMILVDEGKLSLDDPIEKHLPEMKALRLNGKEVKITIRHLLTHTSGMSELKAPDTYACKTLAEAASKYAQLPVQFEPGSKWQYSQTSINTAARIVEVVAGLPYEDFLAQRLFVPLGMKDTTFYLTEEQLPRLAKSYRKVATDQWEEAQIFLLSGKSPTSRDRFPAANGGLFSTANDYAQFCRMLLHEGELDGKRTPSANAVQTFRTVQSGNVTTGFTPGNGWGVGCCIVREPQGVSASLSPGSFGHGGAYGTQAWIDPVNKRVYLLMVQRSNFPNSDASDLRRTFQDQTAAALNPAP